MSPKARKLLNDYAQAVVNDSWKGSKDPEDFDEIQDRLDKSFQKLDDYITHIEDCLRKKEA